MTRLTEHLKSLLIVSDSGWRNVDSKSLFCNKDKKTSTREVKKMRVKVVTHTIFPSCSSVYWLPVRNQSICRNDEENAETIYSKEKILFPRECWNVGEEWHEPRSLWRRRRLDNNAHFISLVKPNLWPHPSLWACYDRRAYGNSEGSLHQQRSSSG